MSARHGHLPRIALAAADAAAAAAAAALAYWLRFGSGLLDVHGRTDVLPGRYAAAIPAVVGCGLAAAAISGFYDRRRMDRAPRPADLMRLAFHHGALLATLALLWRDEFQYARVAVAVAAVLFAPADFAARSLVLSALARAAAGAPWRTRAAVLGSGRPVAALAAAMSRSRSTAADVALVDSDDAARLWPRAARIDAAAADASALAAEIASRGLDEVWIAHDAADAERVPRLLVALEQTTADVRVVPDLGDAVLVNADADVVGGLPVVTARQRPHFGLRAALKRTTDVALAAALLVASAPVIALCALVVRLTSPGPALYTQERMGLDGRKFRIFKLRTMRTDAEDLTGPVFAAPSDPRATPFGRFLRRFSIDELPQLVNVLRGEMSLVGPRPERPSFIAQFRARYPGYMLRHSVKAGMTGWAQVHGFRGESSLEDRLRYDLEYIERWSFFFDLEILGRTAFQVVAGRNAC
ncbi:MAG: hypothetical protein HMLKMBBP_01595 [Planctomycetes bacterium]|nr:hypothetical protein [Planctomycetota bacterium]